MTEIGAIARAAATTRSYDLRESLPTGVTLARASAGTWYDEDGNLVTAAAGVARFSRLRTRLDKGAGLLVEPATSNLVPQSGVWGGAVAASDLTAFNTTTGNQSGVWGTLPTGCALIVPPEIAGNISGWQVVATGVAADGREWFDICLTYINDLPADPDDPTFNKQAFRFFGTTLNGIAATLGEAISLTTETALIAGDVTEFNSNIRTMNGVAFVGVYQSSPPFLATWPETTVVTNTVTLEGATVSALAGGWSVAIAPGASLDVTLRVVSIQVEKAPSPTSLLPAGVVNRAADVLTVDADLGAGKRYVRWVGMWKTYEQAVTAAGDLLTLAPPSEAVTEGSALWRRLLISTQPFAPDSRKLRYAPTPFGANVFVYPVPPQARLMPPAALTSPMTGLKYGVNGAFEPDLDVELVLPPGFTGPLRVQGGRCVRIIGGSIVNRDTNESYSATRSTLAFYGQSIEAYVEGLSVDCRYSAIQRDGINMQGLPGPGLPLYSPRLVVQNTRIVNLHGQTDQTTLQPNGWFGNHSDFIQAFGPTGDVLLDKFTGTYNYQGFFLIPTGLTSGGVTYPGRMGDRHLARVNVEWADMSAWAQNQITSGYGLWLSSPAESPSQPIADWMRTTLHQVYVKPSPLRSPAHQFAAWPPPVASTVPVQYSAVVGENNLSVAWASAEMRISGCVRIGAAPADFVTEQDCGDGYRSPGYGWTP